MSEKIFKQVTNKERDIEAVLDGYERVISHHFYLAEALQKDIIQNAWDARIDKVAGKNWSCVFKLIDIGKEQFLVITDEGTKGLIGTEFNTYEELMTILQNDNDDEDLATFCSSNWSRKKGNDGGNRGRGKVVFLGSSRDKRIYFDSYRSSDGRYVMVELYITDSKEIEYKIVWDEEAKNKLANISKNKFLPLETYGTRIIILNPYSKIVEAMKKGNLLSYINNTWWEIIKKYNASITIDDGFAIRRATCPTWYYDNREDITINKIVIEDLQEIRLSAEEISNQDPSLKIRSMVLRYSPSRDIPLGIKGIAIQRGGMTIERYKTEDLVKEQGMSNIYGWIELNEELSRKMKECEAPEHFNFIWTKNPARYLIQYLRAKCRGFARELELIEDENAKKNKIQKQASQKAAKFLTPLFKKLNLSSSGGSGGRVRIGSTRQPNERLRLSIADFALPNDNNRINYNESIKGAYVFAINEYERDFLVQVRVWIESDSGQKFIVSERELNLSNREKVKVGVDLFKIDKNFEKGIYSFRARMILLEDSDIDIQIGGDLVKAEKSTTLYDRVNKKFYLEIDPPETGPFSFEPRSSDDRSLLIWDESSDEDNTLIFCYNILHPKLIPLVENKDDSEPLTEYLISHGVMLMYKIKIDLMLASDDDYLGQDDIELSSIIRSKSVEKVFPYLLQRQSEALWDYWNQ